MYFQGGKDHPLFFAEKRNIGSNKEGKKKKKKEARHIGTNKQQTLKNHQIVTYQYNKKNIIKNIIKYLTFTNKLFSDSGYQEYIHI